MMMQSSTNLALPHYAYIHLVYTEVAMGNEYRSKVFKSGNSVALRLPKALGIAEGTEMRVREEAGRFSFEPASPTKRKFNVAKVAGSATSLQPIRDEDRVFDDRPLAWGRDVE
jgi:antitoxin VapB